MEELDWGIGEDFPKAEQEAKKIESTGEEMKLPRVERKALIKERIKEQGVKQGPLPALYHLSEGRGEKQNRIEDCPEIAERLLLKMEQFAKEIRSHSRPIGISE